MKKVLIALLAIALFASMSCKKTATGENTTVPTPSKPVVYTEKDLYYYGYTDIKGKPATTVAHKGKKIMFVNTATYCGNTPQYAKLEQLYKTYSSRLVIIGFPCNQFGLQEPGNDSTIAAFCLLTYGITFPLSSKVDVNGANAHPIYKWLTKKSLNDTMDSQVAWNFQKYLVDENGKLIAMFPDTMQPDDPSIKAAIEK